MFEIATDIGGAFTVGVLINVERKISVAKSRRDIINPEKNPKRCVKQLFVQERGRTDQNPLTSRSMVSKFEF